MLNSRQVDPWESAVGRVRKGYGDAASGNLRPGRGQLQPDSIDPVPRILLLIRKRRIYGPFSACVWP
jgi:hypothetical protein